MLHDWISNKVWGFWDLDLLLQVTDAVKVGVQAIKENHVTLAEVQTCLEEVDEAISQQRETQTALGKWPPLLFLLFFVVCMSVQIVA